MYVLRTYVRNRRLQACLSCEKREEKKRTKTDKLKVSNLSHAVVSNGYFSFNLCLFGPSETLYFRRFLESKLGHFRPNYYIESIVFVK